MLTNNETKPLHPLSYGNILIVGAKASNFDDELKTHPRIIMWDSQNEHWTDKDLPHNVRAVFITRWIGHKAFSKILAEARKKQITIFNPEGTGIIARQVRELLAITKQPTVQETVTKTEEITVTPTQVQQGAGYNSKLHVFLPFIDWDKNNTDNAKALMVKAGEMKISSTIASLANFIGKQRRAHGIAGTRRRQVTRTIITRKKKDAPTRDVAVEMLDNMVKELQDMRDYLVATTEENRVLKLRIEKFKKVLDND